jgi:hypothetical protein
VIGAYGNGEKPVILGSIKTGNWDLTKSDQRMSSGVKIWKTYLKIKPVWIWIIEQSDTIKWAEKKETRSDLKAQSDWCYENGYVYLYSEYNPEMYKSIEAGVLDYVVGTTGSQKHIYIENIEIAFAAKRGIRTGEKGSFWIIQNNRIHHVGNRIEESGDGITHYSSNSIIKNNLIYECGNHGIYVLSDSTVSQNNIIEKNEVFNCYHNNIDLMNRSGIHTSTIVRRNLIYCTNDFTYRHIKSRGPGANGIYISGKNGNRIQNCVISHNIVCNSIQMNIHIGKNSDSISIFNNTLFTTQRSAVPKTACLYVNTEGVVIIKNNIGSHGGWWAFRYTKGTNVKADYNCWFQAPNLPFGSIGSESFFNKTLYQNKTGNDIHSIFADPNFKNGSVEIKEADFSLKSNSSCIDAGCQIGEKNDFFGNPIPSGFKVDIGAIELIVNESSKTK